MTRQKKGERSNALISVYDKTGIVDFAKGLTDLGWNIYASGGTAQTIKAAGIEAMDVSELVGGQAILGHRVVTLSREIAAGVLADLNSDEDIEELERLGIPILHLICVDPYPLEAAIAKPAATEESVILDTDIGGPTLLRAAAKARRIVLSVSEQRNTVLSWLRAGKPDEAAYLRSLASRATYEIARYTAMEAAYWNGTEVVASVAKKLVSTKYGENPWQNDAAFYADNRVGIDPLGLDQFNHVQGMERSFINMTDIDRLLQTVTHIAAGFERNFNHVPPIAVGVKHGNVCGAAFAKNHTEAAKKMLEGDTRAIFGGVVMINGAIDKSVAEVLMNHKMATGQKRLLDGVVGASVTDEALIILNREKLRVVVNPALSNLTESSLDKTRRIRPVRGGILAQPNYTFIQDLSAEHMERFGKITTQQKQHMVLGWAVGSTSNSNTITLVNKGMVIGNGVGQQDRVGAGQLAVTRTTTDFPVFETNGEADELILRIALNKNRLEGAIAYSDSFFPFPDGPMILAQAGIKAILTSSGSLGDKKVIRTLSDAGVSILMVPDKIGRGFYAH